jgi:hypothetical protein
MALQRRSKGAKQIGFAPNFRLDLYGEIVVDLKMLR